MIMSRSTGAKAEEMARRADEKQRQINEVTKKVSGGAPLINPSAATAAKDELVDERMEVQSEFSAVTNESEIRTDENVLDFVIQDAEYYFESFKSVLDEKDMAIHSKTLITFVTIDFYNHDTETSQLAEGYRPLYNTQFSFKNRIDDFFVQFLQKNTLKLDVYLSKNNAAVHLGRAEISLRELVESGGGQSSSWKTPVVQKTVRVMSVRGEQMIGNMRFKMRMRKPVSEAIRYFREKNEIENIKAFEGA